MPLLTVRLTDEEHAALKKLAAGSSMAELIRGWIAAGRLPEPRRLTLAEQGAIQFGVVDQVPKFRPAPKPGKAKR